MKLPRQTNQKESSLSPYNYSDVNILIYTKYSLLHSWYMTRQYLRCEPNWPLFVPPTDGGAMLRGVRQPTGVNIETIAKVVWRRNDQALPRRCAPLLFVCCTRRIIISLNRRLSTKHTWTCRIRKGMQEVGSAGHSEADEPRYFLFCRVSEIAFY